MKTDEKPAKPKVPRGKRGAKADGRDHDPATDAEFEREGLGVAAKE